jgi:hypothetical protein
MNKQTDKLLLLLYSFGLTTENSCTRNTGLEMQNAVTFTRNILVSHTPNPWITPAYSSDIRIRVPCIEVKMLLKTMSLSSGLFPVSINGIG